ncbi:hypothetical protein ACIOKD_17170 [Streptomyces sp. NPDC087844]|uniref:hypothetical protein n=1 Tax=Streptomyces sp. NPDC087844 TaxID=3365805 RepID=UPI003827DF9C
MAGDEDGFSGIDPEQLARTIQSLQKDQEKLKSSATWIKSSFERYGVETEPLTELLAIAGWSENQLPMLRRRHHLSIAEDEKYGHGYKGMVRIKESMVGQTKQSVANGKKLGDEFKEKVNNGEDITPEMFADLRANKADADYVKAFYNVLGSQGLLQMSNEMSNHFNNSYKDYPDQREKDRAVIAETFGTFTKVAFEEKSPKAKQQAWNKWFDGSAMDEYEGFRPDRLTPLLKGGSHDKDFLVAFGDRVFKKNTKDDETRFFGSNGMGEGEWSKDNYAQLFGAISQNPEASGEWFDHNSEFALKALYPTGPWKVDEPKERGKAFFELLNSGSVALKRWNPALAEKNTARILFDNYQHRNGSDTKGMHPIEGTQAFYASIITAYWNDLEYGVTSPVSDSLWGNDYKAKGEEWSLKDFLKGQDSGRSGLEVSENLWRSLMEESARDPKAAGTLSALFQTYDRNLAIRHYETKESREEADSYDSMKRGMMQQFYVTTFKTASTELKMDIDRWVEETNNFRATVIDTTAGVAAAGAGGAGLAGVKGAAVGVAYGLAQSVTTGWIKEFAKVDSGDAPRGLREQFKGVEEATADFSWQGDYQTNAKAAWAAGQVKEVTVTSKDEKGNWVTEVHSGNPADYAKGRGNFLDENGDIKKESKMSQAERTAYAKWLQDAAVVDAVWPEFSKSRNARDYAGQDE